MPVLFYEYEIMEAFIFIFPLLHRPTVRLSRFK